MPPLFTVINVHIFSAVKTIFFHQISLNKCWLESSFKYYHCMPVRPSVCATCTTGVLCPTDISLSVPSVFFKFSTVLYGFLFICPTVHKDMNQVRIKRHYILNMTF